MSAPSCTYRRCDGAQAIISVKEVLILPVKVIRSSAGSVFHLPIVPAASFGGACQTLRGMNAAIPRDFRCPRCFGFVQCISVPPGKDAAGLLKPTHGVFGNEAQGNGSDEEMAACDALVMIPMSGQAESLQRYGAARCASLPHKARVGVNSSILPCRKARRIGRLRSS